MSINQTKMRKHFIVLIFIVSSLSACQMISPIFVDYNGVRMDVAKWINTQTFLSMQQKRSLAQLSKAQQQLYHIDQIPDEKKLEIAKQNTTALYCARLYLTERKISQLQDRIFSEQKIQILERYSHDFPRIKLDENSIHCE